MGNAFVGVEIGKLSQPLHGLMHPVIIIIAVDAISKFDIEV